MQLAGASREGQPRTGASVGRGSSAGELREWVYYVAHRDWCDHLIFCGDGSYTHAALRGSGTWQLSQNEGERLLLHLYIAQQPGKATGPLATPKHEVFVSPDGSVNRFIAGTAEMLQQGPEGLPSRALSPAKRRGLLFSSVGGQCLPVVREHWLSAPQAAEFDVALAHYGAEDGEVHRALQQLALEHSFVEVLQHKDFKWPNFRRWMELHGGHVEVAARYDYIWVVDDDVRLSTDGINELFSLLREHENIQFACPSFDDESEGVWRYFDRHDPQSRIRYTDFVECTAPVLKTTMLLDPIFNRCLHAAFTGCFLDFCFHPASGARADSVAIVDAVQCHHPFRDEAVPSELRALMPWEEHKQDAVFFEEARLPKDWWWYRKPVVLSSVPAGTSSHAAPAETSSRAAPAASKPPLSGASEQEAVRSEPTEAAPSPASLGTSARVALGPEPQPPLAATAPAAMEPGPLPPGSVARVALGPEPPMPPPSRCGPPLPFAAPMGYVPPSAPRPPRESRFPGPTDAEDALRLLAQRAERGESCAAFAVPAAPVPAGTAQEGPPLTFPPRVRKTWQTLLSA